MFQTATSGFIDEFDILKTRKVLVTGVLCVIELLAGIFCVTRVSIIYTYIYCNVIQPIINVLIY